MPTDRSLVTSICSLSASRPPPIGTPTDRALSHLRCSVGSMDINILVGPVYERQRAQSTDISNPDVNHALCVPMGIHIGRVSLCTQACQTSTCSIIRKPTTIGTPTDKQASVTNVRSMISIESLPFVRQHILVGPVYERHRAQSTGTSDPDT